MELGWIKMRKFSKPKYPTKQTINLAAQEIDYVKLKKFILSFVVCSIGLILFIKFGVIDRFKLAEETKNNYLEIEQQIQMIEKSIEQQGELQELYDRLNNTFLSESEAKEIDRIEIMDMVEKCIFDKANIASIHITNNQITVSVIDTTLTSVSEIVAALEDNEKTAYVTVFTAQTKNLEQSAGKVTADIMVQLKAEEDSNE